MAALTSCNLNVASRWRHLHASQPLLYISAQCFFPRSMDFGAQPRHQFFSSSLYRYQRREWTSQQFWRMPTGKYQKSGRPTKTFFRERVFTFFGSKQASKQRFFVGFFFWFRYYLERNRLFVEDGPSNVPDSIRIGHGILWIYPRTRTPGTRTHMFNPGER